MIRLLKLALLTGIAAACTDGQPYNWYRMPTSCINLATVDSEYGYVFTLISENAVLENIPDDIYRITIETATYNPSNDDKELRRQHESNARPQYAFEVRFGIGKERVIYQSHAPLSEALNYAARGVPELARQGIMRSYLNTVEGRLQTVTVSRFEKIDSSTFEKVSVIVDWPTLSKKLCTPQKVEK